MKSWEEVRAVVVSKIKEADAQKLYWQNHLKRLDELAPVFEQIEQATNGAVAQLASPPKRLEGLGMSDAIRVTLHEYAREKPRTLTEIREYMVANGFKAPEQNFSESVNSIISRWVRSRLVDQSENKEGRKMYKAMFPADLIAHLSLSAQPSMDGVKGFQR